jgi:hypothetical protein
MPHPKSLFLARWGALGALAAFLPSEALFSGRSIFGSGHGAMIMLTTVWTAILAVAMFAAFVIGQNTYLRRPAISLQEATVVIGGGAASGALAGLLGEMFFQAALAAGAKNLFYVETARIIAWGIFGSLLGFGMSFVIPNLGRGRGALAGLVGGAVGSLGFIVVGAMIGDLVGRLAGSTILGFTLGYAIGLVEEVARTAWLEVRRGRSGEMVKVSLGPETVCVGSNSQRCAIWAPAARPIAFRFRYAEGTIICDDMAQERTMRVDPGFEIELGDVRLTARVGAEGTRSTDVVQALQPPTAPPPLPTPPRPAMPAVAARVAASPTYGPIKPMPGSAPPPPPPPPPPPRR